MPNFPRKVYQYQRGTVTEKRPHFMPTSLIFLEENLEWSHDTKLWDDIQTP